MIQRFLTPVDAGILRFGRERRIGCPARGCRPSGNEETREHDHAGNRPHPKRKHVQLGKGHIARCRSSAGSRKLPKQPTMIGMTTKKIMIVACMVKSAL